MTATEIIGGTEKREIVVVDADPSWGEQYADHERRICSALGTVAVQVEHIGSTSVPGLAAKPIIDVLVVVDDLTDEQAYLPPLLAAGYALRVREPGHRLVRTPQRDVHVHVLEVGDPAIEDYLVLRDRLRRDDDDRELYARTKRALASRDWPSMDAYSDAKTGVIRAILHRGRGSR
ncbi:GrpB family protein [Terracoccus luteus]|uniref:GrpB family protein n=1 Tax=Terracoccus luteus TaxID=53356 RepID=UPI00209D9FD5|nr:GrpB family protein [Terracoccus luteus]